MAKPLSLEDAQKWVLNAHRSNSAQPLDPVFSSAMAQILVDRVREAHVSERLVTARQVMSEALADPNLRITYIANVAVVLHERYGVSHEMAQLAANDVLGIIFVKDNDL